MTISMAIIVNASNLIGHLALSPSPVLAGEGRGEGAFHSALLREKIHPLPNPLPEYREREQDGLIDPRQRQSALILVLAALIRVTGGADAIAFQEDQLGDPL